MPRKIEIKANGCEDCILCRMVNENLYECLHPDGPWDYLEVLNYEVKKGFPKGCPFLNTKR